MWCRVRGFSREAGLIGTARMVASFSVFVIVFVSVSVSLSLPVRGC